MYSCSYTEVDIQQPPLLLSLAHMAMAPASQHFPFNTATLPVVGEQSIL